MMFYVRRTLLNNTKKQKQRNEEREKQENVFIRCNQTVVGWVLKER